MKIQDLLERGYFPRELPPVFSTRSFAAHVATNQATMPSGYIPFPQSKGCVTKPTVHNLARAGSLRRRLSLPNPIAYHQLATVLEANWTNFVPMVQRSSLSLTTPQTDPGTERAIVPAKSFSEIPNARAAGRAGMRYVLQTDINTFYPSVYTHSIPWAIHTKAVAKANRSNELLGNLLDTVIRNGQDQQTVGIPIGPDSSLLVAELILSCVDEKLKQEGFSTGFRYVDDFELTFKTYSEAEKALAVLQQLLTEYELQLNPRKTIIAELPLPLEAAWTPDLRVFPFRKTQRQQATDLLNFFGKAFQLVPTYRNESLLKYAVARMSSETIDRANWKLYEDLLLQCASIEPGTLSVVVVELFRYRSADYPLDYSKIATALGGVLAIHGPLGHGSEVAWAIWAHLLFSLPLDNVTATIIAAMNDTVVALLLLDAQARGLIRGNVDFSRWQALMTAEELLGEHWLLAYEATVKAWLPAASETAPITQEPYFSWLRSGGVTFYDVSATQTLKPVVPATTVSISEVSVVVGSISAL